jgi:hypothetical protein
MAGKMALEADISGFSSFIYLEHEDEEPTVYSEPGRTEMAVALASRPDDTGQASLAWEETLRRAEEALQRAHQWADWMKAAEDAQQRRCGSTFGR